MTDPLVSIIIPFYNCAAYAARAIESALQQSYMNTELILVDNASDDDTVTVLSRYQSKYPKKISLYHETKRGAPAARNKGLNMAKGQWIQFLDADDIIKEEKIARQIRLFKEQPCDLVVGNSIRVSKYYRKRMVACRDPWVGLLSSRFGNTCANLWKKELLSKVGGWDESLIASQEYYLLFEILKRNPKLCFDDAFHTIVYRRGDSISKSPNQKKLYEILKKRLNLRIIIRDYLVSINKWGLEEEDVCKKFIYGQVVMNRYNCPLFYRDHKALAGSYRLPPFYRQIIQMQTWIRHIMQKNPL